MAGDAYAGSMKYWDHSSGDLLHRLLYTDIKTYLVELLMKQDQMSMAASVESRVPFLDHALVEFTASIPAKYSTRGMAGKCILKSAVQDLLPDSIVHRQKMGFPTPWAYWLAGPSLDHIRELLMEPRTLERGLFRAEAVERLFHEHTAGHRDHGNRIWRLLNLELWQRIFLDGEPVPDVSISQAQFCGQQMISSDCVADSDWPRTTIIMVRKIKRVTLDLLRSGGVFELVANSKWRQNRLLILCYHGTSLEDEHLWRPALYMSPEVLRQRLQALRAMRCAVLPLGEALTRLRSRDLPPRSVAITVDDGTYDFYKQAYPLLKKYDLPVTVYQTTYYTDHEMPVFNLICSYMLWKRRGEQLVAPHELGLSEPMDLRTELGRHRVVRGLMDLSARDNLSGLQKNELAQTVGRNSGARLCRAFFQTHFANYECAGTGGGSFERSRHSTAHTPAPHPRGRGTLPAGNYRKPGKNSSLDWTRCEPLLLPERSLPEAVCGMVAEGRCCLRNDVRCRTCKQE